MPRYFVHLYNDQILRDEVGQTFPDDAHARAAAIVGASEIIAENIAGGMPVDLRHRIEVEHESGDVRAVIRFADLFTGYRALDDADSNRP